MADFLVLLNKGWNGGKIDRETEGGKHKCESYV